MSFHIVVGEIETLSTLKFNENGIHLQLQSIKIANAVFSIEQEKTIRRNSSEKKIPNYFSTSVIKYF